MVQQKWIILLVVAAVIGAAFFFFGHAIISFLAGAVSWVVGLVVVAIGAVFGAFRRKRG